MKRKHNKYPPHPKAPAPPPEPVDIDETGNLSNHEKQILAETVAKYGEAAGKGISQIPADYAPKFVPPQSTDVPNVPNNENLQKVKDFMTAPVTLQPASNPPATRQQPAGFHPVYQPAAMMILRKVPDPVIPSQIERAALVMSLEKMTANAAVGGELFANLTRPELVRVIETYQQAVTKLLITGTPADPVPLDYRGLAALSLRSQEDRHNRACLLELCRRLDISAEELTLDLLKQNLAQEVWRLGQAGEEIPELQINAENELQWTAYKEELGLVKRKKVTQ